MPEALAVEAQRYSVHPACLDACLHILAANLPEQAGNGEAAAYMPIAVQTYQLFAPPSRELTSHVTMRENAASGEILTCDARIFDGAGRLVIEVQGLKLKRVHRRSLWRSHVSHFMTGCTKSSGEPRQLPPQPWLHPGASPATG